MVLSEVRIVRNIQGQFAQLTGIDGRTSARGRNNMVRVAGYTFLRCSHEGHAPIEGRRESWRLKTRDLVSPRTPPNSLRRAGQARGRRIDVCSTRYGHDTLEFDSVPVNLEPNPIVRKRHPAHLIV